MGSSVMAPELKTYIRGVTLTEKERAEMDFSDPAVIRMYPDYNRIGVRLKGTYHKWKRASEYPTVNNATVRLPMWEPQAVKGWLSFQEISDKPDDTEIGWRVSYDGVNDLWWNGGAWVTPTTVDHWNTEVEVATNIGSLDYTQRSIQFIARLKTDDRWATPILRGFNVMMVGQFDYWEDLILRSLVPRLRNDLSFIVDFAAKMTADGTTFNVKDELTAFTPDKAWDIVGIDSIYNNDTDSDHDIDLFSSFNISSGLVTMSGSLTTGTRVFINMVIQPDIVVNFRDVDYIEVGKTPSVVIESISINGRKVVAFREMVDMAALKGYQLDSPFHASKVIFTCSILTGGNRDNFVLMSKAQESIVVGLGGDSLPCLLKTKALDERITMMFSPAEQYSPRPNFSGLRTSTFGIILSDFYVWHKNVTETAVVQQFVYTIEDRADSGPAEQYGVTSQLPAGAFPFMNNQPEIDDG